MLTLQQIRENGEAVVAGLNKKWVAGAAEMVQQIQRLDEEKRQLQLKVNDIQAAINKQSAEIGQLMKTGAKAEAEALKAKVTELKQTLKNLEPQFEDKDRSINELLVLLPNLPHHSVPAGCTADENEVVRTWGEVPVLSEDALPHWELIKKYNLIDFERGNKVTGAGFPFYTGKGARLQRALVNFFLDEATNHGYYEMQPPILINRDSGFGTGQLPDKDGQMYFAGDDELYLIPTAEVPITNYFRDEVLKEDELPIKMVGFTPCFRREAGSWGAHVRGLNRLHQFDKVEIVQITKPEHSYQTLEEMSEYVQQLLQKLALPYRVLRLCGGDMSFASALTYDMEVFSAAQERWLEVSSVSNFETFQSNRAKIRYKSEADKKTVLAHTLNGSALALPRIVAALLENNQRPDGIYIPEVLVPYTGFSKID